MVRDFRPGGDWASRGRDRRGFTLVELMLALGIVAVLSALATYGVRRYLALARSAEALQTVGAISRAVVTSVERLQANERRAAAASLCGDAIAVPSSFSNVRRRKYQPNPAAGVDYNTGSETVGWKCLGFEITQPQSYQYRYRVGGAPMPILHVHWPPDVGPSQRWAAYARGDLDGDGRFSWFAQEGFVKDGQVSFAGPVGILDQEE